MGACGPRGSVPGRGRLAVVLGGLVGLVACGPESAGPPGFVVLLADDLGWADCGFAGSRFHRTPNIDALAAGGLVFTDAYAASPVCSPSRASLLTGRHPVRHEITVALGPSVVDSPHPVGSTTDGPPERRLWAPVVRDRLQTTETTFAERLRAAGYRTGYVGKWHLGPILPDEHGFDTVIGADRYGVAMSYFSPYGLVALEDGPEGEYLTDRVTDEAIGFLRGVGSDPFLLFLAYFTPHAPWMGKPELVEAYAARVDPEDPQHNPIYAAMVQALDESVGRLRAALDDLGLAQRTLVVFTSDNGGMTERVMFRHNEKRRSVFEITSNAPLRAGKGQLYEGGLRVPFVLNGPQVAGPGRRSSEPVVGMDLYPTLLALAGLAPEPGALLDGVDLSPLVEGEADALGRDALRFHLPHQVMGCAIRRGDLKLVHYFRGERELYDLAVDLGETNDLARARPELAAELEGELLGWLHANGAHFPGENPDFVPRADSEEDEAGPDPEDA